MSLFSTKLESLSHTLMKCINVYHIISGTDAYFINLLPKKSEKTKTYSHSTWKTSRGHQHISIWTYLFHFLDF